MNKRQLADKFAERCDIPKSHANLYINTMVEIISEALLAGDQKVTLSDFGTWTVSQRRKFIGHNPKTFARIQVPARRIPVFRAGKGLKEALNKDLG